MWVISLNSLGASVNIGGKAICGSEVRVPGFSQRIKLNNRSGRKQARELEGTSGEEEILRDSSKIGEASQSFLRFKI